MLLAFTTSKWNALGIWGLLCWRQCWKLREVSTRFRLCWAIQARYGAHNGHARFDLGYISTWDKDDWVNELWHLAYYLGGDFMTEHMPGEGAILGGIPWKIPWTDSCREYEFWGKGGPTTGLWTGCGLAAKCPLFLDSCGLLFVYPKDSKGEKPGHRRFRTMVRLGL